MRILFDLHSLTDNPITSAESFTRHPEHGIALRVGPRESVAGTRVSIFTGTHSVQASSMICSEFDTEISDASRNQTTKNKWQKRGSSVGHGQTLLPKSCIFIVFALSTSNH